MRRKIVFRQLSAENPLIRITSPCTSPQYIYIYNLHVHHRSGNHLKSKVILPNPGRTGGVQIIIYWERGWTSQSTPRKN